MKREMMEGIREIQDSPERRAAFQVAIFGTGSGTTEKDQVAMENASQIASQLVENGFSLATGGYGGTMEAASKAGIEKAEELGLKPEDMVKAFPFEAEKLKPMEVKKAGVVRSKNLPERLTHLVDESSAYVVLGGGQGTVIELFTALGNENIRRTVSEEKRPNRPVIIVDPSLEHTDLLTSRVKKEKKLQDPEVLNNVYVLGNHPQAGELTKKIVEASYQQNLGAPIDEEMQKELQRYSLGEFIKNQEEFREGSGI